MIKQNVFAIAVIASVCVAFTACGQTKHTKQTKARTTKAKKVAVTNNKPLLLQATTQTTLPGRPETEPTTETRFVIVWKSKEEPISFFWRGEQSWLPCDVNKVKNYKKLVVNDNDNGIPEPLNYEAVQTGNQSFKTGDTLELYPVTGGKHPIPAEIPTAKNNVIYYKSLNSKWLALPVDKIVQLPSIAMP